MKLVANIKLLPTPEQRERLAQTLQRANAACNFVAERAWETHTFKQFPLHTLSYVDVRGRFGLSASASCAP